MTLSELFGDFDNDGVTTRCVVVLLVVVVVALVVLVVVLPPKYGTITRRLSTHWHPPTSVATHKRVVFLMLLILGWFFVWPGDDTGNGTTVMMRIQ